MILTHRYQLDDCITLEKSGQHIGKYNDLILRSVFQPIFNNNGLRVGVEAFARITTSSGTFINPFYFFNSTDISYMDKLNVERLSCILHIKNFAKSQDNKLKLFLNVLPLINEYSTLIDINSGVIFSYITEYELTYDQIIIEIIESDCQSDVELHGAVGALSRRGYHIAVDDFGSDSSNKQRVELLKPDIIKLDRSLLNLYSSGEKHKLLNGIELARSINAKIVVEGIETAQHLKAMKLLKADMFQGYFLGLPKPAVRLSAQIA